MKYIKIFRTLSVALILALLLAAVPATPALAQAYLEVTPTHGEIGDRISIYGAYLEEYPRVNVYFSDEAANVGERIDNDVYDYELVVPNVHTTNDDELYAYFYVPDELTDGDDVKNVGAGSYYVYLTYYLSKQILAADEFTVESVGAITLDPEEGTVGTEVEISGEGFDEEEDITVEYDGDDVDIVSGDEETDDDGEFGDTIIIIPASIVGDHTITVIGDDSEIEVEAVFTVEPEITITPESGEAGDTITVSGTGFADREDFSIFFDDEEVIADETTNRKGSFEVTFAALSLGEGPYYVEAEDEDDNSDRVKFTIVAPAPPAPPATISLSTDTGYAGDEVTVIGTGFQANKSIPIIFYDELVNTASTDIDGKFTTSFTVPVRTSGTYKVTISDGINTAEAYFDIEISASISPTPTTSAASPGHVGAELTVSGVGFTAGKTVNINYDGSQVATATAKTDGSFSATFNAPASSGGEHSITASDGTNTNQCTFVMESTPPPIPAPLKPEMGIKAESEAYFDWEDVTDPSGGVTYALQIATNEDFSEDSIVLEITGLTQSEYTVTKEERLQSVSKDAPYYWRVKAVDDAFNESQWSGTGEFYVGFSMALSQPIIYTLFGVGALALAILGFWLGRKTAYY